MESFDYLFYLNLYPDLRKVGILNKENAYKHYITHGVKEGRICNSNNMKANLEDALKTIAIESEAYIPKKKVEEKINILIRTSNRPEYFPKCIKSILEQKYENYNVIICYDKDESLDYLKKYESYDKITYFPIYIESKEKYKFNLYLNVLIDKVENGWIMFLDDDDMLCHDKVFSIINDNLKDDNSFYLWKFLRPDKVIFPKDINTIRLGEISGCAFIFNSIHKSKSRWHDKQYGDYAFYRGLISKNLNIKFIDFMLTKTVNNNIIGLFGN